VARGTATTGRRLDPDARRAQLVALGLALIKDRPFDQVLVDEVIRGAGISKGLLFHYFPTKRDFQAAVIRAAAAELVAALEPDPGLPVGEQFRHGIDAYIAYIERQPASYMAIVRGAGSDDQLLEIFEQTRTAIVDLIVGRAVPEASPVLRLMVRGWIAMVEEATFLWLTEQPCPRDVLIDLLERTALTSLPIAADLG
jgi:AcrR family transcriptional regulator